MSRQLILIAMHGAGGAGKMQGRESRYSPSYPWQPESDEQKEFIKKHCEIDKKLHKEDGRVYGGLFWKAVIDAGFKAHKEQRYDEVKVICSMGIPILKGRVRYVCDQVRKLIKKSECSEHIVIPVGKSMGVFDSLRALRRLKKDSKKNCCISFSTPLALMVDGDNSPLNRVRFPAKIVPAFIEKCLVFRQENTKRSSVSHFAKSIRGRKLERVSSCCPTCAEKGIEDYCFPVDTTFPTDSSLHQPFQGAELNHWTIDEYMALIGYKGWTIGALLDSFLKGNTPSDLDRALE